MKKELEHFYIGDSYGGNQDWFDTFMMRKGGCAVETACDMSIYLAMHKDVERVYPFSFGKVTAVTKENYVGFAYLMEPYLKPRLSGIDSPELYIGGYNRYLEMHSVENIDMYIFRGDEPYEEAVNIVREQINAGYPIPTLILNHRNKALRDYEWHWFLINGYDESDDGFMVKAVTYGSWRWIDLKDMWDTGYSRKGGFVIYEILKDKKEEIGETVRVSELAEKNGYDNRIGTIKDIVELTGVPLLDAKEMADEYYDNGTDRELKVNRSNKKFGL